MKTAIIIPARYASTRLPGKPLQIIGDKPMILHVANQARHAKGIDEVWIATDHPEIYKVADDAGYKVTLTREDHETGTDRIAEANNSIQADLIVNVQGDEPFINPRIIEKAIEPFREEPELHMSTLATQFKSDEEIRNLNFVKVVTDINNHALYFSRSVIPNPRDKKENFYLNFPYLRHIGLYVYRKKVLEHLAQMKPVGLEQAEKLEQLRALYYGYSISVVEVNEVAMSVDTQEDLEKARAFYAAK